MFMQIAALLTLASLALPQTPDTLNVAKVTGERNISTVSSAPVQRVSSIQLERTGTVSLQEALRTFAGVSVKDYGGIGGLKTVSIRNFGSQHTGIDYDGITVSNTQNGQVDISRFNLDDVQSISVEVSGSEDIFRNARLASGAGTLSIVTAKPQFDSTGTQATAQMRFASFGTYNPYLSIKQRLGERWSTGVWANYLNSRGDYPFILENGSLVTKETRLNSDVSSLSTEMNIWGDLGKGGDIRFKLTYYDSERGLPGSVILYTQNPTERLWDRDLKANVLYTAAFGEHWRLKAGLGYGNIWNRYTDVNPSYPEPVDDRYLQQEGDASMVAMWSPSEHWSVSFSQDLVISTLDANTPNCLYPTRESSYTALSGKFDSGRLTAVATLLGTIVREQTKLGEPTPGRQRLSPSASISYRILESSDLRLRASFKESYRLPTFNDLYYPRVGSKELSPERAYQTNAGITWAGVFGSSSISLTCDGYWNTVRDKIVAIPTMFIWSMRNVGKVTMLGCDLTASYNGKVTDWLRLRTGVNYSYQYAVDVTDPQAKNYRHQIAYTPRHCGSGSLVLEMPWCNVGYTVNAVGERYTLSQNTPAYRTAPYADHALSINRTFEFGKMHNWKLHLSAEALNLGNVNYEIIKYYPMPGRNYRLTIRIAY